MRQTDALRIGWLTSFCEAQPPGLWGFLRRGVSGPQRKGKEVEVPGMCSQRCSVVFEKLLPRRWRKVLNHRVVLRSKVCLLYTFRADGGAFTRYIWKHSDIKLKEATEWPQWDAKAAEQPATRPCIICDPNIETLLRPNPLGSKPCIRNASRRSAGRSIRES